MSIVEMIAQLRETETVDLLTTLDDLIEEYQTEQKESTQTA